MSRVLLTRRIPSSVLARLEAEHDVDLYSGDGAIPRNELLRRIEGKAAGQALGRKAAAVDAAIVGVIDAVELVSGS